MTVLKRLPSLLIGAIVVAVVVVLLVSGSGSADKHVLYANFQSATNLVSGSKVTAGGQTIGSVGSIKLVNGDAQVQLNISDDTVWPMRQGTRAEIRWGGTVSYSNRYVELIPGPAKDQILGDNARLPTSDTVTPVEFDQLFNVFNGPTRQSLGGLIDNGASTFSGRAKQLHNDLSAASPSLNSISGVLQQLGEDPNALETLISAGDTTASALHAEQPQLTSLVADAANTFQTIADNAHGTQATLAKLSPALNGADTALNQLDPTLTKLNTLVGEIRPGAQQLKELAGPLNQALTKLTTVAPQLNSTLSVVQSGAPRITSLLNTAKPVLTSAKSTLDTVEPMTSCLLSYGPEIGGFIVNWQSFLTQYNAGGHYARALAQVFPAGNDSTQTPAQFTSSDKSTGYALIRPPGFDANNGSTQLQSQCGAGTEGLTAADDPEAK